MWPGSLFGCGQVLLFFHGIGVARFSHGVGVAIRFCFPHGVGVARLFCFHRVGVARF